MAELDFDLRALYDALDEQRRSRGLSWSAATKEINRFKAALHPIATSTVTGLKSKALGEGDGILQMLRWLDRTPESFVPGFSKADAKRFRLPQLGEEQILRFDTRALHSALDLQRRDRDMTWKDVAAEVGGFTPSMLANLAKGGRTTFPGVMRIVRWLDKPAAIFTRASNW